MNMKHGTNACICEDDRTVAFPSSIPSRICSMAASMAPAQLFGATAPGGGTRRQALILHVLLALNCASAYASARGSLNIYRSLSLREFSQPACRPGSMQLGHGLYTMHGAPNGRAHPLYLPLELQRRVEAYNGARVSRFGNVYAPSLSKTLCRGTAPTMRATSPKADEEEQEEEASDIANQAASSEPDSRDLLRFILPTLGTWLSSEVMSVVDTAVVGSISASDLAALGPATMLTDGTVYLFFWLNVAATNLFASALARGDADEAYSVLSDALWVGLGCGLALAAALACAGPTALAAICANAPQALSGANKYLQIRLLGVPAFICGTVLQAACLGAKDATSPLLALAFGGILNLVLDILLVFRFNQGIAGAALATLAAQLAQTALLAVAVTAKRRRLGLGGGLLLLRGIPKLKRISVFLSFAGPIFLVLLGKVTYVNAMTLAATGGGVVSLAAHQVISSVFFLGCKFGDATSQTAQAFLPSCLAQSDATEGAQASVDGARPPDAARRLSRKLLQISYWLGGFVALGISVFVSVGTGLFTSDAAVSTQVASVAPLLFLALLGHAATMCSEGLLLGARQLKFLASSYAGILTVFISGMVAIGRLRLGLRAVWTAAVAFQVVRLLRFRGKARQQGLL